MIGLWHSVLDSPRMKFEFKIAKKYSYTLNAVMEPIPLPLKFTNVIVHDRHLRGTGEVFWNKDEELVVELDFQEDTFGGSIYIPSFGTFPWKGSRGRGPNLGTDIMHELVPYSKTNVPKRKDEEIAASIDRLMDKISFRDKIGQMFQCQASVFSFGGEVESDPPEQLVKEGRVGSILGAFNIGPVFELQ